MVKLFSLYKNKSIIIIPIIISILFFKIFLSSYTNQSHKLKIPEMVKLNLIQDLSTLRNHCSQMVHTIELLKNEEVTPEEAHEEFYRLKRAYKKVEFLLEYLDPVLAKNINGAPIPKVEIDHQPYLALNFARPAFVTYPPEGLQVLEEILFSESLNSTTINEAYSLAFKMEEKINLFQNNIIGQPLTEKQIIESLREHLVRVMTMGITGFDAPAAGAALEFALNSLEPVQQVLMIFEKSYSGEIRLKIA
jgi:cytochrome c peroxidase